jgi:hypothetical protein
MNKEPCILVVTPTLGESKHLGATVESVAALPLRIDHVLAAPIHCLDQLKSQFPRVRLVPDAGRLGGIYGAINAALAQTTAAPWEWFTYINDDDLLTPEFAAMARDHFLLNPPEPVAYGDVDLIDGRDRFIGRVTTEGSPTWIPALLQQGISPLMQQGTLFHRPLVERLCGFDTRYRLCADLDFWLRAYVSGARFRYHRRRVAKFRIHHGQLSGDTAVTEREQDEIVRRHLPHPTPLIRRTAARWQYRISNLPRYVARYRLHGFRTSYQLLRSGAAD